MDFTFGIISLEKLLFGLKWYFCQKMIISSFKKTAYFEQKRPFRKFSRKNAIFWLHPKNRTSLLGSKIDFCLEKNLAKILKKISVPKGVCELVFESVCPFRLVTRIKSIWNWIKKNVLELRKAYSNDQSAQNELSGLKIHPGQSVSTPVQNKNRTKTEYAVQTST